MKKPKKKDNKWTPDFLGNINFERGIGYNQSHVEFDKYFKYLLSKIPSDKQIKERYGSEYASIYYQGVFDTLINLINGE